MEWKISDQCIIRLLCSPKPGNWWLKIQNCNSFHHKTSPKDGATLLERGHAALSQWAVQSLPGNFCLGKWTYKQATAVGLVLARQDLPDCPGKGRTLTQFHCAEICVLIPEAPAPFQSSVRRAGQHQHLQGHHSYRKRRATCYNHGLLLVIEILCMLLPTPLCPASIHQVRKWRLCINFTFYAKQFTCSRHQYWWLQTKRCSKDTSCNYIQAVLLHQGISVTPARTQSPMPAKPTALTLHIYSGRCFSDTPKSGILHGC